MLNDGLPGPAPEPSNLRVHLRNQEDRARERAREWAAAEARAIAERFGAAVLAGEPLDPPPTTAGPAIPTPLPAAGHARPELPRGGHAMRTPPAGLAAQAGDPRLALELRLRRCGDLPAAIREVRHHLFATGDPDERALGARLDRAEQLYAVHYEQYLTILRSIVRGHAIEALRLAGLDEFAGAVETSDFGRILGGPR